MADIDDMKKNKDRRKLIERLRPPARVTPGTGPGGIPMANAASSPEEEMNEEDELFGMAEEGDDIPFAEEAAPADEELDPEAEQAALRNAAVDEEDALFGAEPEVTQQTIRKKKRKPAEEDENLDVEMMVPFG